MNAGLIDEFLDGMFTRLGAFFVGMVPEWLHDPFWVQLLPWGVLIIIVAVAVAWFLGALPVVGGFIRAIAGVIVLLVTFGLYAYRKGENDARARLQKRQPVKLPPKPRPPPPDRWPFGS